MNETGCCAGWLLCQLITDQQLNNLCPVSLFLWWVNFVNFHDLRLCLKIGKFRKIGSLSLIKSDLVKYLIIMATVSTAPHPGMHQIDLSKLNLNQLAQLKQQLDQVINILYLN